MSSVQNNPMPVALTGIGLAWLGLQALVMHPGSYTTGTEGQGLALIADALHGLLRARPRSKTMILLEHTAGQGTNLGHRFEHLAVILDRLDGSARVGVCLDTCHLLAAGYDFCSEAGYAAPFQEFRITMDNVDNHWLVSKLDAPALQPSAPSAPSQVALPGAATPR